MDERTEEYVPMEPLQRSRITPISNTEGLELLNSLPSTESVKRAKAHLLQHATTDPVEYRAHLDAIRKLLHGESESMIVHASNLLPVDQQNAEQLIDNWPVLNKKETNEVYERFEQMSSLLNR